jgi:hypothetical protein
MDDTRLHYIRDINSITQLGDQCRLPDAFSTRNIYDEGQSFLVKSGYHLISLDKLLSISDSLHDLKKSFLKLTLLYL